MKRDFEAVKRKTDSNPSDDAVATCSAKGKPEGHLQNHTSKIKIGYAALQNTATDLDVKVVTTLKQPWFGEKLYYYVN